MDQDNLDLWDPLGLVDLMVLQVSGDNRVSRGREVPLASPDLKADRESVESLDNQVDQVPLVPLV